MYRITFSAVPSLKFNADLPKVSTVNFMYFAN